MNLDSIKKERQKWLNWKNIAPLQQKISELPKVDAKVEFGDTIDIVTYPNDKKINEKIKELALMLKPWRKGPFKINDIFIDSEWKSFIKYNFLANYFDLKEKIVADVGCNNGYYMFRMLTQNPKKIVGFDPSPFYKTQFDFLNHFIKSDIEYEMLGVEHLEFYPRKFDTIFCLGVLYHRQDPIGTLKSLKKSLNKNGELFLDTFTIQIDKEYVLFPKERYSKIPNVYFIPSPKALYNWLYRAGFKDIKTLGIFKTTTDEQRKTSWIDGESLEDFLDPNDLDKTIEGYPAPTRIYIKATLG